MLLTPKLPSSTAVMQPKFQFAEDLVKKKKKNPRLCVLRELLKWYSVSPFASGAPFSLKVDGKRQKVQAVSREFIGPRKTYKTK